MTDKQIIIDNIDVSGCKFYSEKLSTMKGTGLISVAKSNGFCTHNIRGLDNSSCYDAHIEFAKCKNNNCYFKQHKRKEQECEELKKELESTKGLVTVGNRQIIQSLEKVEDLKNELHSKVEFIQEQRNIIDEYSKENEMYKKCQGSRASKREEKLKQTLTEIKEIAEGCQYGDCHECKYQPRTDCRTELILHILQKINEVEDES